MSKQKRPPSHKHLLRLHDPGRIAPPTGETWPGVSDPSLAAPDAIKFDYGNFAAHQAPGQPKLEQFEENLRHGPLGFIPEIDDWAMEEFIWHGVPGDEWHPLEAYLAWAGDRFPPPAQAQLRLWKEARLGFYEVGEIHDGTVALQEWDVVSGELRGTAFRAVALCLGGVNAYRGQRGQVTLTYVAPWAPADNLFCAMGYGVTMRKRQAPLVAVMLGLRQPQLASLPYPWKVSREAENKYLRQWQMREWQGWLKDQLVFPFRVWLQTSERGALQTRMANELMPQEPAMARQMGIYMVVPAGRAEEEVVLCGLTKIMPTELDSPNWLPIAEYQAYRERVGPPPGTIGQPDFHRLR
jgi:hypothetical protein